jgi:type II secretory pathway component GspD/PulD (secretin)
MVLLLCVAIAPALCAVAVAEEQKAKDPQAATAEAARSVTRVYDIRDLIFALDKSEPSTIVPPTRLGQRPPAVKPPTPPSTQPTAEPARGPETPESLTEEVVDLIRETVDPESWRDNGGTVGAIRSLSGQLIVTQSPENQRQIANLFEQLRQTRARHVTVQARWVALSQADLKAVAKPLKDDPTLFGVDLAALDKLGAGAQQWYGQMTFFNSMTVRINSGRARTVITDQVPVVGAGAPAYQPSASLVQAGLVLEVTAVLNPAGDKVTLNVQSVASDWQSPPPQSAGSGSGGGGGATTRPFMFSALAALSPGEIDRVEMVVQQMRTSVSLPSGQPVIIGGMTLDPGEHDPAKQLYLVIQATGTKGD